MALVNQTLRAVLVTASVTAAPGAAMNADSTPTVIARRNGSVSGISTTPTITNLGTGRYLISFFFDPADGWVAGDCYALEASWTMETRAGIVQEVAQGLITDDVQATLDAIKGGSWSTETLKAIYDLVGTRLADADYLAPDNATLATIATQTDTVEASLATLLSRVTAAVATDADLQTLLSRVPGDVALEATLTAIKGAGWSDETLKAIKDEVASRSTLTAPEVWAHGDRTLSDKTGYSLASTEHAAIASQVDTQLSGTHGADAWTAAPLTGSYTVTIVVRSQATSGALTGVRVTLKDAADATVLDQKYTSSAGSVQFTADAATYQVHLGNTAGYESLAAQELVVTESGTVTYYLNPLAVSTATDPALCVVYGYVYQNGAPVVGTDVTAKLTSKGAIADEILLSIQTLTDTTDSSGYFELELVRSDQFTVGEAEYKIVIEATGINQVVEIPNQASINLAELLHPQL